MTAKADATITNAQRWAAVMSRDVGNARKRKTRKIKMRFQELFSFLELCRLKKSWKSPTTFPQPFIVQRAPPTSFLLLMCFCISLSSPFLQSSLDIHTGRLYVWVDFLLSVFGKKSSEKSFPGKFRKENLLFNASCVQFLKSLRVIKHAINIAEPK